MGIDLSEGLYTNYPIKYLAVYVHASEVVIKIFYMFHNSLHHSYSVNCSVLDQDLET